MKQKLIIVSFLIIALIGAFSLKSNAQQRDKCPSITTTDSVILADETTLTTGKSDIKIETYSDEIFYKLYKRFEPNFKRYTCSFKTDRHGRYKVYTIYLQKEYFNDIVKWSNLNL